MVNTHTRTLLCHTFAVTHGFYHSNSALFFSFSVRIDTQTHFKCEVVFACSANRFAVRIRVLMQINSPTQKYENDFIWFFYLEFSLGTTCHTKNNTRTRIDFFSILACVCSRCLVFLSVVQIRVWICSCVVRFIYIVCGMSRLTQQHGWLYQSLLDTFYIRAHCTHTPTKHTHSLT